jgi:hypothetical protein
VKPRNAVEELRCALQGLPSALCMGLQVAGRGRGLGRGTSSSLHGPLHVIPSSTSSEAELGGPPFCLAIIHAYIHVYSIVHG